MLKADVICTNIDHVSERYIRLAWKMKHDDLYAELDDGIIMVVTRKRAFIVLISDCSATYHPYPAHPEMRVCISSTLPITEPLLRRGAKLANSALDYLLA